MHTLKKPCARRSAINRFDLRRRLRHRLSSFLRARSHRPALTVTARAARPRFLDIANTVRCIDAAGKKPAAGASAAFTTVHRAVLRHGPGQHGGIAAKKIGLNVERDQHSRSPASKPSSHDYNAKKKHYKLDRPRIAAASPFDRCSIRDEHRMKLPRSPWMLRHAAESKMGEPKNERRMHNEHAPEILAPNQGRSDSRGWGKGD